MANHEDREIIVNNCPLIVHRGQKFTSIRKLADRWHWSRSKLERYIKLLKSSGMIAISGTHGGTLLTIINYGFYQDTRDMKRDVSEAMPETPARTRSSYKQEMKVTNTLNNEKKEDGGFAAPDVNPDGIPFQ